jgi:hypothetical protein
MSSLDLDGWVDLEHYNRNLPAVPSPRNRRTVRLARPQVGQPHTLHPNPPPLEPPQRDNPARAEQQNPSRREGLAEWGPGTRGAYREGAEEILRDFRKILVENLRGSDISSASGRGPIASPEHGAILFSPSDNRITRGVGLENRVTAAPFTRRAPICPGRPSRERGVPGRFSCASSEADRRLAQGRMDATSHGESKRHGWNR